MADFTQIDSRLAQWIDEHQDEIIESVQSLIKIPSVKGPPTADAPFGIETRRALENVLDVSARYGFANKMLDGYAAHAEFGAGEEMIGVLAHVDVVPAGSDWKHEPFGAVLEDGKIFGRGAIDDKGPCIAGLYALIAVKETDTPIGKRLRMIIGADEESGFGCMDHYFDVAREEMPTMGFTPDGRFPLIYAEKGIASPTLTATVPPQSGAVRVTRMTAGERSNMVPDRAEAKLSGTPEALAQVRKQIQDVPNVTCASEGTGLVVKAVGVSAHGSMPEDGVNAVKLLTAALLQAPELSELSKVFTTLNHWATDTTGGHLGIAGSEEISGPLTANLGLMSFDGSVVSATFSIRHPVTWTEDDLRSKVERGAAAAGFELSTWNHSKPLYVPLDSPLISTLLGVYRDETGDMTEPKTMGGGTYARVLKQGVAFGPNFPGFPDNAHQADEYWTVEDLMKATKIYAKALARLAA